MEFKFDKDAAYASLKIRGCIMTLIVIVMLPIQNYFSDNIHEALIYTLPIAVISIFIYLGIKRELRYIDNSKVVLNGKDLQFIHKNTESNHDLGEVIGIDLIRVPFGKGRLIQLRKKRGYIAIPQVENQEILAKEIGARIFLTN